MDISYIKDAIEKIFSQTGYTISNFSISFPTVLNTRIEKEDNGVHISFSDNFPVIKTKKFLIPIVASVESILLGKDSGKIKLKYFPELTLNYKSDESTFGSNLNFNSDIIREEICKKYPDNERRKIADLALEYANEWATIATENGVVFDQCNKYSKKEMTQDCYDFVRNNIVESKEIEAKFAVLGTIILYFLISAIVSWVVKKFLDNIFN